MDWFLESVFELELVLKVRVWVRFVFMLEFSKQQIKKAVSALLLNEYTYLAYSNF